MESLKKIDVSFAYSLLTLDDNNFSSLPKFMNDFRQMFFDGDTHSLVVFLNSVYSLLNVNSVMGKILCKHYYEFEIRDDYQQFIIKYQSLLQELIEKDLFYVLFRIMCNESDYLYFIDFYNYLISNYDNKLQIMKNLYDMYTNNIFNFSLVFEKTTGKDVENFTIDQGTVIVGDLTFDSNIFTEHLEEHNFGVSKSKVLKV